MMAQSGPLNWLRIMLAAVVAEVVPILLLVLIVVVYGFVRQADSPTPAEFAPRAGNWVGPIGGFLATLFAAWFVARRAAAQPITHGLAVGIGAAILDIILGILLSGGEAAYAVFFLSNVGRITAGLAGGFLAARRGQT
jgi:hypothetical protein